jgi:hypothetical protein
MLSFVLEAQKKFNESHWCNWILSCKMTHYKKNKAVVLIKDEYTLSFIYQQVLLNIRYQKEWKYYVLNLCYILKWK